MFASLQITERKPITPAIHDVGEKTLFVAAQQNWPASSGAQYPNIPLDIEIEVKFGFGSITSTDKFRLSNLGSYKVYSGDLLEVFAYYTNEQGLATPYTRYNIVAEVFPGIITKSSTSKTRRVTLAALPINVTTFQPIPSFSHEFRYTGSADSVIFLYNYSNTGANWNTTYWSDELREWRPLPSLAVQYTYYIKGCPYGINASDWTLEFR